MSLHDSMKRLLPPALLCVPVLAFGQASPAPDTPKLTDEQTASIMKQLDQIEATITKTRTDTLGAALTRFRSAMNGEKEALELYLACIKLENFDRKDLKATDFQDWRDRNEGRNKDPEFLAGLRLQLEYLVLTIQAQDAETPEQQGSLVTALQAYLPKAVSAVQASMKHNASGAVEERNRPGGPRGGGPRGGGGNSQILNHLRQSVKGSIFSQAYQLDQMLTRQDWEYSPLNLQGAYRTVILPYYLEQKPTELPAQYDAMINGELAIRKSTMSESEFALFYKEQAPDWQWGKATYLLANKVTPILAMADMLKIIRENPTHPKAGDWVKQLRQAVNETQAPAVPTSTEPAAAPQP